jgi:hypothetical protein
MENNGLGFWVYAKIATKKLATILAFFSKNKPDRARGGVQNYYLNISFFLVGAIVDKF